MNPPHRGHLSLALHACRHLAGTVEAIYLLPAHDNLLHNQARASGDATPCWHVEARCELLRCLAADAAAAGAGCPPIVVVAYESEHASQLLCDERDEWAARLPDGYCKTVPLARLLHHFAASGLAKGARLAVLGDAEACEVTRVRVIGLGLGLGLVLGLGVGLSVLMNAEACELRGTFSC